MVVLHRSEREKVTVMSEISRATARQISEAIDEAVVEILAEYGLKKQRTSTKYGSGYTYKIEATIPSLNEEGVDTGTAEARCWENYAYVYYPQWVTPEADAGRWLGLVIESRGKHYAFAGYNSRARSMPLQFTCVEDGRTYKFRDSVMPLLVAAAKNAGLI